MGSQSIAALLHIAPSTAVRVGRRFLERGAEGLIDARHENGVRMIDDDLLQALAEIVVSRSTDHGFHRPTWTREALAKALHRKTGVRVSVSTIARMLDLLGARYGRPRPIVVCPWSVRRKASRVREILNVVENLAADEVAFYEDEVDLHLNPKIGSDWMMPGQQRLVVTPGKNQKRYLAGALAVGKTDLHYVASERKNSALFIALLRLLCRCHQQARRIHLILDNFSIHSSKAVQRFLKEHGDLFQLHFLPPYSPEHNKIERLWLDLHANVTRNHSCPTIDRLMAEVRYYMRRRAHAMRRIRQRAKRAA